MLTVDAASRRASLVLPERADVSSALAVHEILLRTPLEMVDRVDIDAAAVGKLDCAVLQSLLAWLRLLESQHIPWHWQGISDTCRQVVNVAGLAAAFRLTDGVDHEFADH